MRKFGIQEFSSAKIMIILLVILFPWYLYTMSPTVSVGDSGEFIAASTTLSLPHAPSYPLFTLLGKCAALIIPFSSLAYRVNLVSLFFGLCSSLLLFLLLEQLKISRIASLSTTLIFAFSKVIWEHSVSTEVFSLNTFFILLILCAFYIRRSGITLESRLYLTAFLLGFGMGNHHTLVMISLLIALLFLNEEMKRGLSFKQSVLAGFYQIPPALTAFLIGFSIYAFLPIRAVKTPPINWSDPENLTNFIRVITRADYGSLALTLGEKMPRNYETMVLQIQRYFSYLINDIGWLGLCLGLLGWWIWFIKDRFLAFSFFAFFIFSGIGFLILGNLPFDSQSSGILPRFYMMPAVPYMISIAIFLDWIIRKQKAVFSIFSFGVPLYLLLNLHGYQTFSRHDYVAYDYGVNLLKTLPPHAILFMDGGDDTFYTLAYLTLSEKRRGDLELHDRGGLIYKNPYGDDFRKISKEEKSSRRQSVESAYLGLRPLYYSTFDKKVLDHAICVQRGMLYEALPINQIFTEKKDLWQAYSYRGVYETVSDQPYRLRALIPIYAFMEGLEKWNVKILNRAEDYGTDILWLKGNLVWEYSLKAYELSSQNRNEEAETAYKKIIQLDPKFVNAYSNLGVLMEKKNDLQQAESCYKKAIEIDPQYSEAYYNLGVIYWRENRWAEVAQMFEKTLQLNPRHPNAGRYLYNAQRKLLMEKRK